jgi:hypothetical protein
MQTWRTILLTAAVLAAVVAAYVFQSRARARHAEPASPPHRQEAPAPRTDEHAPGPQAVAEKIMPVNEPSLEKFQEAASRATVQQSAEQPGLPYAIAMARAARQAMTTLGHDPDFTLRYWLSPRFAEEVVAGDPAAAADTLRSVDNLLTILLGDPAGSEEFAQILTDCSPDVQALAIERRARKGLTR